MLTHIFARHAARKLASRWLRQHDRATITETAPANHPARTAPMSGWYGDLARDATANEADIEFVRQMIPHHEQAVMMAMDVIEEGQDKDVRALAERIKTGQTSEIAWMKRWLTAHSEDALAKNHGWLGWIEDDARTYIAFVDIAGLALLWTQREADGSVVGEPSILFRRDLLRRDSGPGDVHVDKPIGKVPFRDLEIHIDRHVGQVIEGIGPDGEPYHHVQQHPYGYLPGVKGDDGEDWDMWVGPDHKADRVHVVTQTRAGTTRYDEQKGFVGWKEPAEAEKVYRDHAHPTMFQRIGSLSYDEFRRQLDGHKQSGSTSPFRAETEEDTAELKAMKARAEEEDLEPPSSGPIYEQKT